MQDLRPSCASVVGLEGRQLCENLLSLYVQHNQISDLSALVAHAGMDIGDLVEIWDDPLSQTALDMQVPALEDHGATVVTVP